MLESEKKALEQKLRILTGKKEMYFQRVQKLYNWSKDLRDPNNLKYFKLKFPFIDESRKEYYSVVEEIVNITLQLNPESAVNFAALDAFEDLYCIVVECSEGIQGDQSKSCRDGTPKSKIRLPEVNLPVFSGNIRDWPVFYECFKSMIHENKSLSDTEKVNYLVGQLAGSAASLTVGMPPVASNYSIIWQTLVDKYQNSRSLANHYLDQILSLKPVQKGTYNNLNSILERFDMAYKALGTLDIDDLLDFTYSYLLLSKLDLETKNLFENNRRSSASPKYDEILKFIKEQIMIAGLAVDGDRKFSTGVRPSKHQSFFVEKKEELLKCSLCSKPHHLSKCERFLNLKPFERYRKVKEKGLCFKCFGNHQVSFCSDKRLCTFCKFGHNTLIHYVQRSNQAFGKVSDPKSATDNFVANDNSSSHEETPIANVSSYCSIRRGHSTVLLSTVLVKILNKRGEVKTIRLLLDSGSHTNLLTYSCALELELMIKPCSVSLHGIDNFSKSVKGQTRSTIFSRFDSTISFDVQFLLVDKISNGLPEATVCTDNMDFLVDLPLADDRFYQPSKLDGIIGADLVPLLLGSKKVSGSLNTPIALETQLGFVVMGSVPVCTKSGQVQTFFTSVEKNLDGLVQRFWELEEVPNIVSEHPDDIQCEHFYASSVTRNSSGRYQVRLPFKMSPSHLGNSYQMALKRFISLEKRFKQFPQYRKEYAQVMEGYLDSGYISLVENPNFEDQHYFIPHHGIFKPDSSSTPLRCVFDASAKTHTEYSLNDLLFTGPKLQSDVLSVFVNFRLFRIAFTADIKQMYLQIRMHWKDRKYQQFLWRSSEEDPIQVFHWNTVVFGNKSSPFLALRTLKQLVEDEGSNFPLASEFVRRDFYMDDLVSSIDDLEKAKNLYGDLVGLLKSGGFHLTKWAVSDKLLLQEIQHDELSPKLVDFIAATIV